MNKNISALVLNTFENDSRVMKEAESLGKAGYQVTIYALHEEGLKEVEQSTFYQVVRLKLWTKKWAKHKLIQLIKYLELALRLTVLIRKSDVIHCNDLSTLPVGAFIKLVRFGRVKVVYDAHEYEINQKPGQADSSIKLLFFIESLFIRFANRVITVSDSIANEYQRLYKIQKPELVRNCPPYTAAKSTDIFRQTFSLRPDQRIFLYQGGLTAGRGLSDLLTLFKSYNDDSKVLVCMGYGALDISVKKASDLCDTIFYHPAVKPDVLLSYTGSADFGISFIEDSCLSYRYCLPNKMFEYFMAGLPVIVSNLPEMRKFVLETEAGFVTSQNNLQGLSEAVDLAMNCDYPKVKANALAVSTLNCWEVEELVLIKVYRELF